MIVLDSSVLVGIIKGEADTEGLLELVARDFGLTDVMTHPASIRT
ncbi:MAG: hypothetical protein ACREFU_02560 [Acetobacteraceae bacterium]